MDFKNFKKNRKKLQETINTKMKDQLKPKFAKDERFWSPTKGDDGNADALIRFLPQQDPKKPPIIMYYMHGFKEKGKWFIENCPSTKDERCPSCEYAEPLWEEDTEESRKKASKYYRTKQFISNILVVKDAAKPENNGKVFLFRFGQKIYDKIDAKLYPESELDEPVNVMDFWEGCNFRLRLRKVSGRNNYDTSAFSDNITPIAKSEKKIEEIFKQIYNLDEFLADENFKSYDELLKKFNRIMKIKGGVSKSTSSVKSSDEDDNNLLDDFTDDGDAEIGNEEVETKSDDKDDDFDFDDEKSDSEEKEKEKKSNSKKKKSDDDDDDFDFDDDDDFDFDD